MPLQQHRGGPDRWEAGGDGAGPNMQPEGRSASKESARSRQLRTRIYRPLASHKILSSLSDDGCFFIITGRRALIYNLFFYIYKKFLCTYRIGRLPRHPAPRFVRPVDPNRPRGP